jgi:hypothetical protein
MTPPANTNRPNFGRSHEAAADPAIARAVAFLRARQLPNGEFMTLLGQDLRMTNPAFDSSPFITSFVVYALAQLNRALVEDIISNATAFLVSHMEWGGVWRYWSWRQHKHCRLPPDLDDSACISFALKIAGRRPPDNAWAFRGNRDAQGRYRTWLFPRWSNLREPWFLFARAIGFCQARVRCMRVATPPDEDPRFRVMCIDRDDVDPVVNANVVLYLGESTETLPAVEFIIASMRADASAHSLYYQDPLTWSYAIARAYRHAAPRLSVLRESVVNDVTQRAADVNHLNPLQAAIAASALQTFAPESRLIEDLLRLIRDTQRDDGGWDPQAFYNVWGSEELTTGLCLEALARSHGKG